MADGVYMVEPAKPWHKTRLTAEQWFLRNPPHVWRTLDAAVEHYMASGFELVARTPRIETELTGEGYAILTARSRYTPKRYFFRTVLPWTIVTLGAALPIFIWHYIYKSTEERYPSITIQANPDGSGTFLEERQKTGSMLIGGEPMVHPETGQTGWSGCPDDYYRNVIQGW